MLVSRHFKKSRLFSLALVACGLLFIEATTSFSFISNYPVKANSLAVDNFGNFYAAADNKVLKFGPDGKFLYPYEEFKYGKVGMVDVTNPMKVLVFYPDFMTVVTLDKYLAPLTTYNFFNLGYQNVTAVGSSIDGRLWFYDNTDYKLKKIDETGKIFRESQPLNAVVEETPNPNFLIERDDKVYVNDPNIGIMVFDLFGSYAKTIPLKGLNRFQLVQGQIIYQDSLKLKAYNPVTFRENEMLLPDTAGVIQAVIEKHSLGILKRDSVDFYRY